MGIGLMSCGKWKLANEIGHGAYGVVYLTAKLQETVSEVLAEMEL